MNSHRIAAALSILAVTGQSLAAGISLVSGPGTLVVNPNNQRYYADPYNIDMVFYWTEQTSHVLANDLVVSVLPPGSYPTDVTSHSADSSLTIAQGTTIDSFLLYYDPQSSSTVASFAFDDPIVGLITNSATSDADDHFRLSDYLINPLVPGANIPVTHYDARGIELASARISSAGSVPRRSRFISTPETRAIKSASSRPPSPSLRRLCWLPWAWPRWCAAADGATDRIAEAVVELMAKVEPP